MQALSQQSSQMWPSNNKDFIESEAKVPRTTSLTSLSKPGEGSYDSTITNFEAELAASEVDITPVEETLQCSSLQWARLRALLGSDESVDTAPEEAGRKLVINHEAVLRDVTNPSPHTQLQLARVPEEQARHADQALRELSRRLLRRRPGGKAIPKERLDPDPTMKAQATTWTMVARYLEARIQTSDAERPGRKPDMSPQAATAMRAVLQEMWWAAYSLNKQPMQGRRF